MKQSFKFRRTTVLSVVCLSFLVGLVLGRTAMELHWGWVLVSAILLAFSFKHKGAISILAATLLGISIGMIRGGQFGARTAIYENYFGLPVVIEAVSKSDGFYADGGQLEISAGEVELIKPDRIKLPGRIKLQGHGVPALFRGDVVRLEGKLFPTGGSNQAKLSYSQIEVLGRSGNIIEQTRLGFTAGMQTAVPEPQAAFGLGLLVGQRDTLPDEVSKQLSIAGLTHIIAVSGYNLTIIVRGVRRLSGKLSKYQSTMISVVLLMAFLLFTGFSASIVRAAIISGLSLAAWYYGRSFKPVLLISLAAAITAGWNPIYIWSDIGWYLSFLAFFGVLIVAPLLEKRLFKRPPKFIGQVVLESVSAQLMAVPLILYIFSEVSLVALISNIIIVPMVPLAMLLSVVGGLGGMIVPVVSGIIAWPATAVLTYMLDLANIFSRIPYAKVEASLTILPMIVFYAFVILWVYLIKRRLKLKYGTITDRNILE